VAPVVGPVTRPGGLVAEVVDAAGEAMGIGNVAGWSGGSAGPAGAALSVPSPTSGRTPAVPGVAAVPIGMGVAAVEGGSADSAWARWSKEKL
jgi:hypothetical protein